LSNPDDAELAGTYSSDLVSYMMELYPYGSGPDRLPAYKTELNRLANVYQKHHHNERVALNYLYGIGLISKYIGGNVAKEMVDIVTRFPHNTEMQMRCADGLFFLVEGSADINEIHIAENYIRYVELLQNCFPKNDYLALQYAQVLQYVHRKQSFFKKRKTVSELKRLAERYPHVERIVHLYNVTK